MPRFLTMIRLDENVHQGSPGPETEERMMTLFEEITKAGVMLDTGGLVPTADSTRVNWSDGRISYTDGPFTETKEVVGGYLMLQAKDKAEAVEWTRRFLELHPVDWKITVEVREILEPGGGS